MTSAVLLFSGGLDSATCLYMLHSFGAEVHCLGVDYGQPHRGELELARQMVHQVPGATWTRVNAPHIEGVGEANVYPYRNGMLLALGAVHAAKVGAVTVVIGCNADDARDYPDCREEYLTAYSASMVLVGDCIISAPLLQMSKRDVAAKARELDVPIGATRSCYATGMSTCGICVACKLRAEALA